MRRARSRASQAMSLEWTWWAPSPRISQIPAHAAVWRKKHEQMKRSVGYAYPWDYVGDPAAAPRAADLGLDAVAVAASYHATRAATPLHPHHRIFEAEHAACYVPVREQVWRGHRLVPHLPAWDPDGDSFGNACRQLTAEGLQVQAWIVLTHNSALGRGHPDLVVRNAFGDVYPYALCQPPRTCRSSA